MFFTGSYMVVPTQAIKSECSSEWSPLVGHYSVQHICHYISRSRGLTVGKSTCVLTRVACYLRPQLSADVVGVQGEERLPRSHVQHPLVVGQRQHAVVEDSLDAEPGHAVQHIWRGDAQMLHG